MISYSIPSKSANGLAEILLSPEVPKAADAQEKTLEKYVVESEGNPLLTAHNSATQRSHPLAKEALIMWGK